MTLQNRFCDNLSCQVSDVVCMYDNGDEGSELRRFNARVQRNRSIDRVYIESKATFLGSCMTAQSKFALTMTNSDTGAMIGKIVVQLGKSEARVVENTADRLIYTSISREGDRYIIDIKVTNPPLAPILANSAIKASAAAIQKHLKLDGFSVSKDLYVTDFEFTFTEVTIQGLETLECISADVDGDLASGLNISGVFVADRLFLDTKVTTKPVGPSVEHGILLQKPWIRAALVAMLTSQGNLSVTLKSVDLNTGHVVIPDSPITNVMVSAITSIIEGAIKLPFIQSRIVSVVNDYLPH
ncbi:MAG: hypothetical protein EOP06_06630 [Proteobacteria bacterium]|nr:MAG: hypothetical protein EOP06_06630 [Pseudomonadota bacterium]